MSEKIEKNKKEKKCEKKNEKRDVIEKERKWVIWLELESWVGQCFHKISSLYMKGCSISNYNNLVLPSVFQSVLQEFEHKIDFILGLSLLISRD